MASARAQANRAGGPRVERATAGGFAPVRQLSTAPASLRRFQTLVLLPQTHPPPQYEFLRVTVCYRR